LIPFEPERILLKAHMLIRKLGGDRSLLKFDFFLKENQILMFLKNIVEAKGYHITRKQKKENEEIWALLEEDYIKEGADIEVDGIWVKAKKFLLNTYLFK
jgi:hypothetical protein